MASRLSLAARLYSIFALFALLTAAIAVLSDYNTRRATELTHAIETSDLAALDITTAIAGAISQQDAATREISTNAQSAAQGNETLIISQPSPVVS